MIQRIQTIYLVIAIALMVAFFFVPFGYTVFDDPATGQFKEQSLKGIEFLGLLIPTALSIVCLVAAVFMYRQYPGQQALIIVGALFIGACIGVVVYVLTAGLWDTNPEITTRTVWGGGGLLLVAAWLALWGAYRGIARDRKLISNYTRFRND